MSDGTLNWRRIATDILLVAGSGTLRKLINYAVIVALARYLHKDDIGAFFFAASLAAIASLVSEFGTSNHLVRQVASAPERATVVVSQVLAVRLPLMLVSASALMLIAWVFYPDILTTVALTIAYVFLDSLALTSCAVLVALKRVRERITADILTRIVLLALIFAAIGYDAGFEAILVAYGVANLLFAAAALWLLRVHTGRIHVMEGYRGSVGVLRVSLSFFILMALAVLHFKIDTVMLGAMASLEAVATYEIAYRCLEVSRFVIRPLNTIFLPLCTGLVARQAWPDLRMLVGRLLFGTVIVAVAIGALVAYNADAIIELIFGADYRSSAPILQVLFLALPAVYLAFVGSVLANTLYLEKRMIAVMAACLVTNVLANFYAIPRWGPRGAAWTTVLTETLLAVWVVTMVVRELKHVGTARSKAARAVRTYDGVVDEA